MSKIFNPENGFFSTINKIIDVAWMGFVWSVMCLPLIWMLLLMSGNELEEIGLMLLTELVVKSFLIGPASTALYYTMVKVIRRERGYATKQFFHAFKTNFKVGAPVSMIFTFLGYLLYIDFQYADAMTASGDPKGQFLWATFFGVTVLAVIALLWVFPILSRFNLGVIKVIKMSLYLASRHFVRSFLMVLFVGTYLFLVMSYVPIQFYIYIPIVIPGGSMLVRSFIIEPVFKKYTPESDTTEEESGEDRWYNE